MAASRVNRVSFVSRVIFDVVAAAGTPVVTAVVRWASPDAMKNAQATIKLEKNEIKRRRASSSYLGGNALFYWPKKNVVNAASTKNRVAEKPWAQLSIAPESRYPLTFMCENDSRMRLGVGRPMFIAGLNVVKISRLSSRGIRSLAPSGAEIMR